MPGRNQFPLHAPTPALEIVWVVLVAGLSVVLSTALACITPFVGLATVSAIMLPRRTGLMAVLLAWLSNQMVGYLFLGYPRDFDSYSWGIVIGLAAMAAFVTAAAVLRARAGLLQTAIAAFLAAGAAYEGVLYLATAFLPSGDGAFAVAVIEKVFLINLAAAVGLIALNACGALARVLVSRPSGQLVH